MPTLVLIRHGQSAWNLENRFTGWWDVNLTEQGEREAKAAGELMAAKGLDFDQCYTSLQTRAIKTLNLALEAMGRLWLPVEKDWRLNERHYGGLTGLDKAQTAARHGDEQVKVWRRSFDTPPPVQEAGGKYDMSEDRRYRGVAIPGTESLKDTIARVLPYWDSRIAPDLKAGKRVVISAHGNSLREPVGVGQDALDRRCNLDQQVDPRPVRQGRDHQRGVVRRHPRHQVGDVVGHHERHLAVGQHRRLRPPGGPRRVEEPAGIVVDDIRQGHALPGMRVDHRVVLVERYRQRQRGRGLPRRVVMGGELRLPHHRHRPARLRQERHLVRHLAEIDRNPYGSEPEAGEHALHQLVAVTRLHQHPVAPPDAARGQRRRHRVDPAVHLDPAPAPLAPNQAEPIRMPPRRLAQEMREVHHSLGHGQDAARGRDRNRHGPH